MRFILSIILIIALTFIGELFLPWWMIAVVPFVVSAALKQDGWLSFIAGFSSIAALWFFAALYRDIPNNHVLSTRLSVLFHLSDYGLLIFVVAFVGGFIGGLSAWAGALVRK